MTREKPRPLSRADEARIKAIERRLRQALKRIILWGVVLCGLIGAVVAGVYLVIVDAVQ